MRINVASFSGKDVRISFAAESVAEQHQLNSIEGKLIKEGAAVYSWRDYDGDQGNGIGVVAHLMTDDIAGCIRPNELGSAKALVK